MLEKSVTTAAAFVVFRHERDGLVDDEARRRMRLIVPHIRRAALIGKVLNLQKAEAAAFADTLAVSVPVCFWSRPVAISSMPMKPAMLYSKKVTFCASQAGGYMQVTRRRQKYWLIFLRRSVTVTRRWKPRESRYHS